MNLTVTDTMNMKENKKLTSHLVMFSRGYILNVRLVFGSSMRSPSKPTLKNRQEQSYIFKSAAMPNYMQTFF
jgi:hypothetical protein